MNKGDRVTVFAPGDPLDGRKGIVEYIKGSEIVVSFGSAIAYGFDDYELREGW